MDKRTTKVLKYAGSTIIVIALAAFYLNFIYRLALSTAIDSDYGNLVQEATDIVNGNVFLKGWNQTGVSFLLTDIMYFVTGVIVFGQSKMAYIAAVSLMFLMTMITTLLLTNYKKMNNNIIFFALTAFPSVFVFELLRAHTGGYVLTFIIFIIIDLCIKKGSISKLAATLIVIFTTMISMSDAASLLFGVFAIAIICIYKLIFDKEASKKFYGMLFGIMVSGTVFGMVFDKLYYIIGGANKNSFLCAQGVIRIDALVDKLYVYFDSILTLGNANISGRLIFKFDTIVYCMYVPIVVIGFYLTVKNIKLFLANKNEDMISVAISIGFVLVSLSFIFTTVGVDISSSRYFATLPFFFAVLICRYIMNHNLMEHNIFTSSIKWKYFIMAYSIIALVSSYTVDSKDIKEEKVTVQEGLTGILLENNLKNGYGNYWDASISSLISEGTVNVRQITLDGDKASPLKWFCKDDWYEEYANFVVIHNPEYAGYGVTEEGITEAFGKPEKSVVCDDYVIYIYNNDISKKLD